MPKLRLLQGSDPGWHAQEWAGLAGQPALDTAFKPVGKNECAQVWSLFGGNVRGAVKLVRARQGYSKRHGDYVRNMLVERCRQINLIGCKFMDPSSPGGKSGQADQCEQYVNKKHAEGEFYQPGVEGSAYGQQAYTGGGGSGNGGSNGGGGGGGLFPNLFPGGGGGNAGGSGGGNQDPPVTTAGGGSLDIEKYLPWIIGAVVASKLL
jgi:hypothetical protein